MTKNTNLTQAKTFLFDWGGTLMVDFPDKQGKMCQWNTVKAVDGAYETLKTLSQNSNIYIATNAQDSTEEDIRKAFARVDLEQFISGYFCRFNVGIPKGTSEFYLRIANSLGVAADSLTMVGDTFNKDIQPALEAGLSAIWYNPSRQYLESTLGVKQIMMLKELCL